MTTMVFAPPSVAAIGTARIADDLIERARPSVEQAARELSAVLESLVRAKSPADLDTLLEYAEPRYWEIAEATTDRLLAGGISLDEIRRLLAASNEALHAEIKNHMDLLGADCVESLEGALSSIEGFDTWVFERYLAPVDAATRLRYERVVRRTVTPYLRAQMSLGALALVIAGHFPNWRPESLQLLCLAVDDNMTAVEDVFFAERTHEPRSTGVALPMADIIQRLGL